MFKIPSFYATRLRAEIDATTTTIPVDHLPRDEDGEVVDKGILVLDSRRPDRREIIEYMGVDGTNLIGCTRGIGGTHAAPHARNSPIEGNVTGLHFERLYDFIGASPVEIDGSRLVGGSVTSDKIDLMSLRGVWQPLILENGWGHYGSGWDTPEILVDVNGIIKLRGMIQRSSAPSAYTKIASFPGNIRTRNWEKQMLRDAAGRITIQVVAGALEYVSGDVGSYVNLNVSL